MSDDIAEQLQVGEAIPWSGSLAPENINQDIMNYLKERNAMNSYPSTAAQMASTELRPQFALGGQNNVEFNLSGEPKISATERIMTLLAEVNDYQERASVALDRIIPATAADDPNKYPRSAERLLMIEQCVREILQKMREISYRIDSL